MQRRFSVLTSISSGDRMCLTANKLVAIFRDEVRVYCRKIGPRN